MEIAIGVIFLALFVGAIFLFFLILGLFFRRRKRRNASPNRQFASTANYDSRRNFNDDLDSDNDYDKAAYFAAASYSNSHSQENREINEAGARMSYSDSSSGKEVSAGMSYYGATEGGDYVSSGNDFSPGYDSGSSSNYDSGSSSDSSSSGDSGSSSSSSSD